MGNFSFMTQDTNKSIPNKWTGKKFPVYMIDNKGNRYYEPCYGGYGVFGGKDFYVLVAEMNLKNLSGMTPDGIRLAGINIACGRPNDTVVYPNLVVYPDEYEYKPHECPRDCPHQGDVGHDDSSSDSGSDAGSL